MTVYVAGSWSTREYVRNVTTALRSNGIGCTNGWMDREAITTEEKRGCALADLSEVHAADALLLLGETDSTAGGMHFESGWAFAKGKDVFVVGGKRDSVFHHLPGVEYFSDLSIFLAAFAVKSDCGCVQR